MKILVINCGSSSIKYKLFDLPSATFLRKGALEQVGEVGSAIPNHYTGLQQILAQGNQVEAVGHRVVHGGECFSAPVLITEAVIRKIHACSSIAPLHNPANLEGIRACKRLLPGIKQVAVFDTAFHQTIPPHAYTYALPFACCKKWGIRKYGFHGTSHHYVALEAARRLKRPLRSLKLITVHLGNGCSMTAVKHGVSVDTSMGFTPLEGLVMGTRCGDVDPAVVAYLMQKIPATPVQIENVLNKESGLKGISGVSNDMRELKAKARAGHWRSQLAIKIFTYRIKKYIGAYAAAMGGCDAVVFTAGIGENHANVRKFACAGVFAAYRKQPTVLVIPTEEELMIAKQTYQVLKGR